MTGRCHHLDGPILMTSVRYGKPSWQYFYWNAEFQVGKVVVKATHCPCLAGCNFFIRPPLERSKPSCHYCFRNFR